MAVTVLLSILTLVMLVSSDSGTWTLIEEDSSKVHHVAENLSMNKSKGQQTKAARQDPDTHAWLKLHSQILSFLLRSPVPQPVLMLGKCLQARPLKAQSQSP